jgi:hypothetical protein
MSYAHRHIELQMDQYEIVWRCKMGIMLRDVQIRIKIECTFALQN